MRHWNPSLANQNHLTGNLTRCKCFYSKEVRQFIKIFHYFQGIYLSVPSALAQQEMKYLMQQFAVIMCSALNASMSQALDKISYVHCVNKKGGHCIQYSSQVSRIWFKKYLASRICQTTQTVISNIDLMQKQP